MCYLINFALEHELSRLPIVAARKKGFAISAVKNPSVIKLAPKLKFYSITHGGCSCSIYCNPKSKEDLDGMSSEREAEIEQSVKRYHRKKWSQEKIDRALRDRYGDSQAGKMVNSGLSPEIWDLLVSIMGPSNTLGIIIHEYEGGFDSEVTAVKHVRTTIEKAAPHLFEKDIFYDFS
jgi:hypothetical protein